MRRLATILAVALLFGCNETEPSTSGAPSAPVLPPAPSVRSTIAEVPTTSKSEEAVAAFQRAYQLQLNTRYAEAIEELKKALEKDPDFALALAWLGYLSTSPDALEKLDRAVALAAKLPEAERLWIEELKARRAGDTEKARELAKRVIDIAPFDWRAQLDLGNRYLDERRVADASVAFGKAAAFGPKVPAIYNSLGYAHLQQHRVDAAVAAFRKYAELAPQEPNALDSLGEALMMAGKFREAEAAYTKSAAMGAAYAWEGAAMTRFLRGDAATGMDDLAKARDGAALPADKLDYDGTAIWALLSQHKTADANKRIDQLEKDAQSLKIDEAYAKVSVYRAVALADDGKDGDAIKEVAHAIERADKAKLPGNAAARVKRLALAWEAFLEARSGADASKTAAELEAEAKKAPNDPTARSLAALGHGAVMFAKGDAAGAVHELSECLEDDVLCRWLLLTAEEKAGDATAADLTRDAIASQNLRDPGYLYVRAKVTPDNAKPPEAPKTPPGKP